jgi:hypothetical protein
MPYSSRIELRDGLFAHAIQAHSTTARRRQGVPAPAPHLSDTAVTPLRRLQLPATARHTSEPERSTTSGEMWAIRFAADPSLRRSGGQ